MTYIAYNYEGVAISILRARNRTVADIYWQGAGIIANTVTCVEEDMADLEDHITGVYPILKTKETRVDGSSIMSSGRKIIEVAND